jgi:hypothetical protein
MIYLQLVQTDQQKQAVKDIIENYHSYVPNASSVGRRIDWLIYDDDTITGLPELLGMIGVGSSVYPCPKDLMNRLGVDINSYRTQIFNRICNNWRFCMKTHRKNVGTQVLKLLREKAPIEWEKKYGDPLLAIFTFVAGGNNGAVYKADNWEVIGMSSGIKMSHAYSTKWETAEQKKEKGLTRIENVSKKIILFKDLRIKRERNKPFVQSQLYI